MISGLNPYHSDSCKKRRKKKKEKKTSPSEFQTLKKKTIQDPVIKKVSAVDKSQVLDVTKGVQ